MKNLNPYEVLELQFWTMSYCKDVQRLQGFNAVTYTLGITEEEHHAR